MTTTHHWELLTKKDDLTVTELRSSSPGELRDGEVRLAVTKFALTMNNVTYARLGDSELPFWSAFPAPEGYGRVPVWGFVRVAESRNPGIAVGERYFGYVPLATQHIVAATTTTRGFVDIAPERAFLPLWYRTFQRAGEPDGLDDRRTVFRPLFPASLHLADFLVRQSRHGARSVLVTSASSKTAIGLADVLSQRPELPVTGLTSERNVAFLTGLGRYDTVAGYDELGSISVDAPAVFVDFTGEHRWITAVHERFRGTLTHIALAGYTHPHSVQEPPGLSAPEPEIFFAPGVEEEVVAAEGEAAFYTRYHAAEERFLAGTTDWLAVERHHGPEAIVEGFQNLLTAPRRPDVAHVFLPH